MTAPGLHERSNSTESDLHPLCLRVLIRFEDGFGRGRESRQARWLGHLRARTSSAAEAARPASGVIGSSSGEGAEWIKLLPDGASCAKPRKGEQSRSTVTIRKL